MLDFFGIIEKVIKKRNREGFMKPKDDFRLKDYLTLCGVIKALSNGNNESYSHACASEITEVKNEEGVCAATIRYHDDASIRYEYESNGSVLKGKSTLMTKNNADAITEFLIADLCADEDNNKIFVLLINGQFDNVIRAHGEMAIYKFSPNFEIVSKYKLVAKAEAPKELTLTNKN